MRIKVLYVLTKADVGGAQKYVADLVQNLNKSQFETRILHGGREIKWLSNRVRPWLFFLNDWLAVTELVNIFKKEQPQIVHLNSSKAGVIGSLAALLTKPRPKVIFTAHGWVFNPTNKLSIFSRWFYILLHKITSRFQNKIICVSEYDRQLASELKVTAEANLKTIHNGIDPRINFLSQDKARAILIEKLKTKHYKLKTEGAWIGSIGRLVKEKNYETFIQTAALIPNANFFLIGAGPEEESLKSASQRIKANVNFIEPTGQDAELLKAFDVFVMSSVKEGLPYILLEAMLAGLPAVVTEAGGMPEMIKNHENGLMVAQKNPALLAQAIKGLLTNQGVAAGLGKIASQTVKTKFALKNMISETESIYQNFF